MFFCLQQYLKEIHIRALATNAVMAQYLICANT